MNNVKLSNNFWLSELTVSQTATRHGILPRGTALTIRRLRLN